MASYLISCPSCGTRNRVPEDREGIAGRCGTCGSSLPPLHTRPVQLNDRTFDDFLRTHHQSVLAEFWAPW